MSQRVPASMRTRQSLSELIAGRLSSPDGRAELVKLATRLIVEETLEAENRDALGRDYYEHGAEPGSGYRNGVRTGRLRTAEGLVEYSAPQIAGRDQAYRSEIREHLKGRTQALEDLAVELLARGLSVRDIEDAFRDETGRLLLSRTAVSELGERLWADYQEFAARDLSEYDIADLFVDGIAERIRPGQRREPVMAAWGFTATGTRVLLHLMAGSKEDAETVSAFFQDMRARGLGDPLLVVSDGAPGIIKAIETCFPRSARQRCLAHRMRNLAAKVPEDLWPELKARVQACYQAPSRVIGDCLLRGRLRSLHRAFAHADHPSPRDQDHEPPRALVRRGAPAAQDHPQRLRREARPQADVRRHDPRRRALAGDQTHRLRAPPDGSRQAGTGSGIRGRHRGPGARFSAEHPRRFIQQFSDLTHPVGEGGGEQRRVDPVHQDGQPALARDAILVRQVAAEEAEMRRAPGGDVLVVVAVGDGAADHQQQDLGQRMQNPPHVTRVLHLGEVVEQRVEARLPGQGFGGMNHGGLRIRAAASIQTIPYLSPVT
jgi:putative transposase